jgi:hypothetical protein
MNKAIFDLYSDYLLSSFGQVTATGLSRLLEGDLSHDQVTRTLAGEKLTSKSWWGLVKAFVRQIERPDGVMLIDDTIVEKPHTDENEIICWHFDHAKGRTVKGLNLLTTLYLSQDVALPVAFEIVAKTERYVDPKIGQEKRRSPLTKNEHYRNMLRAVVGNQIAFQYVLNDLWFASADNMRLVKLDLQKDFIMALKKNRKVALSVTDKQHGRYQRIDQLRFLENSPFMVYLEQVPFALLLVRQDFTNEDSSTGERYLVSSAVTLSYDQLLAIYQKRWKVEEYHRSLKQNAALAKSPTRTETTQTNHVVAALWAFVKLEMLKVRTKKNHYELKAQLYFSALQHAFQELRRLQPVSLAEPVTA